ncbi:MAG: hypothetical protein H6983_23840 [Ectothiorhodospiraceae bacterium]|nr:hypothetical protein [Ectothiorhodospiraceae bacterium]
MVQQSLTGQDVLALYGLQSGSVLWQYAAMVNAFGPSLTAASGSRTLVLADGIPPDAVVTLATADLVGGTYFNRIRDLAGVTVVPSGLRHDATGPVSEPGTVVRAWVVDLGASRKIGALRVESGLDAEIELVLPWMGTEFGARSLYPYPTSTVVLRPVPATATTRLVQLGEVESPKLLVQFDRAVTEDQLLDLVNIECRNYPTNVRVAVADRAPFLQRPEPMIGTVPLADFSAEVNAHLAALRDAGATTPLVVLLDVRTDAPGVITLENQRLEYDRSLAGRFGSHDEVHLDFVGEGSASLDLRFEGAGASALRATLLEVGSSETTRPWQALPETVDTGGDRRLARLDPTRAVACAFELVEPTRVHGLALRLRGESDLLLDICPDAGGAPAATPSVSAPLTVATAAADWVFLELAAPVALPAGRHWVVARCRGGAAAWVLHASSTTTALQDREGTGWRPYPSAAGPLCGALKVLRPPSPDEPASAIEVLVPGAATPTTTRAQGRLTLAWPEGDGPVLGPSGGAVALAIEVRSRTTASVGLEAARLQVRPA